MIYIGVPSHNEGRTVGVLLWKIRQVMTEFPRDYQLIVVDDASTDSTAEVLDPYARVLPLTVIRFGVRQGYAACVEALVREAVDRSTYPRRDVLVTLQADFTDDPEEVPNLLKRIESGADVVTSALRLDPRIAPAGLRWTARLAAPLLRRRLAWPEPVTDALSSFRAYRVFGLKKALDAVEGGRLLAWDGWAANAALLDAVKPHVRRMDEVEVQHRWERRQRESRFQAWPTFASLLRLAFGRPAPLAGGGDLTAAQRTIIGNPGLAERVAATERPLEPSEPTRKRRTRKASDRTGERGERGGTKRRRSSRNGAAANGKASSAADDADAAAADASGAAGDSGDGTASRQSRRRRRGRRRGSGASRGPRAEQDNAAADLAEAGGGPGAGGEAAGAGEAGEEGKGSSSSRRRRRGGRGRGGRRRPRPAAEGNGNGASTAGEGPAAGGASSEASSSSPSSDG